MLRPLAYLWAAPNTLLGLLFVPAALLGGGHIRCVDGAIEVCGGWCTAFLRRCTFVAGGASAMTLGHVILGQDQTCLDLCRAHEHVHVRQAERWGPLFLPAYGAASLIAWMRGQSPYRGNWFERQAYGEL
jgi:hypothetical protein